jgi:beta-mannosidase
LRVELRLRYPDGTEQLADGALDPRAARWSTRVEVFNPQLWWPNGYGGQPLYDVTVALYGPDGAPLDQHAKRIGLRTLELRRRKDKFGESFVFVVNGVPIFAKGANWIPADSFPNRVTPERYRFLLQSAAQAHMNMIRVWGGGFYEEEVFYDLCDELGLLVWQDFTFACAVYPTNARFVESFRQEAVEALRRLRHRACLALWCGNNEMEEGWVEWGWGKRFPAKSKQGYDHLYHRLLPAWVAREDPDTPYWPSSPSSGRPFDKPNAEERGDGHYWKVWFAMAPFTEYRKHLFRFMSEFGFQSLPPFETVKTFAEPRDWNMTSRIMEHHQRSGPGNSKIIYQLLDQFRLPKDFASLCYLTQVLQAEGIRYGVEHWRRHRQRVMGILYWQLDDCWPVCSWSSIDYFGRWKALHYAARRFFAPVLLSAEEQGSRVDLHVTNDGRQPFAGRAAWRLETLAGEVIKRGELPLRARPSANTRLKRLDFARELTPDSRRALILVYELLTAAGDLLSRGVLSFVPHKHVELCDPGLQAELTDDGSEWRVTLRARALARFVEVSFEDVIAVWSDNFFDLPAGCERVVSCAKQPGQTLEALRGKLRVRSLWDSY